MKKGILIIWVILVGMLSVYGQGQITRPKKIKQVPSHTPPSKQNTAPTKNNNSIPYNSSEANVTPKKVEIFAEVEEPATFPGGQTALMNRLSNNIRYPEKARKNNIQGRVVVKFVVEKDGSIGPAEITRSIDEDLDNEALRVVKMMPKWFPGKNAGVPVRSYFNLPVTYKLTSK